MTDCMSKATVQEQHSVACPSPAIFPFPFKREMHAHFVVLLRLPTRDKYNKRVLFNSDIPRLIRVSGWSVSG